MSVPNFGQVLLEFVVVICIGTSHGHTDYASRLGSCQVPVPQAFTCRDIPVWSDFLMAITTNAKAGFPPDQAVLYKAQEILSRWQDKPYPPQDFFKYLCGGYEAHWPLSDNFCLFGFVGALFVRSRHLMTSEDPEVRKAADMDFQYATTVLGREGSVDFLDSSPWPVSILDIYININETTFLTYNQYAHATPIQAPAVTLESIEWHSQSIDMTDKVIPARIEMAILGTHATLSLEPVDMLRRSLNGIELHAVFYGLEPRWCQILGICDQGSTALSQLFKDAEKDPYSFPWSEMVRQISDIYVADSRLLNANVLLCTEPLAGCLMLRHIAHLQGRQLPILGYLGVALLNSCPPEDVAQFWMEFAAVTSDRSGDGSTPSVLAVNNMILSEQIYYQSGYRMPYVRAHGLYTGMSYTPLKVSEVLMWRAPLFMYSTTRCAMLRFLQGMPSYPISFRFIDESESVPYNEVAQFKAVGLIPWDHALMTFYEIYSAGVPMMLPSAEWMYRLLYQRGQLSVGERLYQSIMPGHIPPYAEFAEMEAFKENPGPPDPSVGISSAKAARGVAEDMLTRGLSAPDLDTTRQYLKAALELMQDMKYFLTVAENKTDEDSYTSMGFVRRSTPKHSVNSSGATLAQDVSGAVLGKANRSESKPWHPYTPFQMSTRDSNDWTRMRKGGWWLRRGVRLDAMRYWYQFSDFARFPGLTYFENLPELLCLSESIDIGTISEKMRRYNERTLVRSATFWLHSLTKLLGSIAAKNPDVTVEGV